MPPLLLEPTDAAIAQAALQLRQGEVVAFPTETVYGLGGDTFNRKAIRRIYALKGRPGDNPLIAHVLDARLLDRLVERWDDRSQALADRFWPGPLTIVVKKSASVPDEATAGLPTIAVRCPAHEVARALLQSFGGPISAPSANRSGRVSPTRAEHVATDFIDVDDLLILDAGPSRVGIESTVIDLSGAKPRVLRPGSITREQLETIVGTVESPWIDSQASAPGTNLKHYAPRKPAELVSAAALPSRLAALREPAAVLCFDARAAPAPHRALVMPRQAEPYAAALYTALREADSLAVARILIEAPPYRSGVWSAVHDRLRRATALSTPDDA